MRLVLLALALLPALGAAQFIPPRLGSSSSGSSGGIQSVSSLGTCAAPNAGAVVWLTSASELWDCDGTTWRRVFTSRDGVLPNADVAVPAYQFVAQAAEGEYAFKANNRAKWDFGDGVSDECVSTGGKVSCSSWSFADASTDVIATKTSNVNLQASLQRYFRFIPISALTCGTNDSGGLQASSTDGNRPRWCDGTTAYRMSRVVEVAVTADVAEIAASSCLATSVTVTGAAAADTIWANADFALPLGVLVGNVRSTAANSVELTLCNVTAGSLDPASGSYRFRIER